MKKIVPLALALMLAPAAAFAGSCPAVMAEIDAALATTSVTGADLERVRELRAQGEELHNAGDHAGSMNALNEAKAILGS